LALEHKGHVSRVLCCLSCYNKIPWTRLLTNIINTVYFLRFWLLNLALIEVMETIFLHADCLLIVVSPHYKRVEDSSLGSFL
jgi:hypothetical protein